MREALDRLKKTFNDRATEAVPSEHIQILAQACYAVCEAIPAEDRQDVFKGITAKLSLNNPQANGEEILNKLGILQMNEFANHGTTLARSLIDGLIRAHEKGLTVLFDTPIREAINVLMTAQPV